MTSIRQIMIEPTSTKMIPIHYCTVYYYLNTVVPIATVKPIFRDCKI